MIAPPTSSPKLLVVPTLKRNLEASCSAPAVGVTVGIKYYEPNRFLTRSRHT